LFSLEFQWEGEPGVSIANDALRYVAGIRIRKSTSSPIHSFVEYWRDAAADDNNNRNDDNDGWSVECQDRGLSPST
jgi:hypothetical protein